MRRLRSLKYVIWTLFEYTIHHRVLEKKLCEIWRIFFSNYENIFKIFLHPFFYSINKTHSIRNLGLKIGIKALKAYLYTSFYALSLTYRLKVKENQFEIFLSVSGGHLNLVILWLILLNNASLYVAAWLISPCLKSILHVIFIRLTFNYKIKLNFTNLPHIYRL